MDFDEVIMGRRSIRGYKPDLVPRALIEDVLKLAMRAPSSMNTQPWNFYVVTGEPLDRIRAGNTERMVAGVAGERVADQRQRDGETDRQQCQDEGGPLVSGIEECHGEV